jgi:MFS family permease
LEAGLSRERVLPPGIAFRHPNFRYFLGARFLITVASEMQAVAVAWQVFGLTHRPLDLGLVGLAQFLPGILLFLPAGHTADHVSRKRILQCCYGAFAVCSLLLLSFTLQGLRHVWPIYLALIWNGIVRAFNGPASQSFLPLLVPQEHFQNAVAWGASVFQAATIIGPSIGGLVYGWTGSPVAVYASAMTGYLAALALFSRLRVESAIRPRTPVSLETVFEGMRFIWRNKNIFGAMSLDLFAVLLGGAVALLPVYAHEILHVGARGLGLLRAAPGAGAILMAVAAAHWPPRRHAGPAMLAGVVGFGLATVVFGLSRNFELSLAALAVCGACDMVSVVVRQTLVQLGTPDAMRGRVAAVNMVFIGASNEVGQFESGITAQWFGTVPAVVLGGVGTIAIVAAWTGIFPGLRKFSFEDKR